MNAVVGVRNYRAMPGKRAELIEILADHAFPIQRRLGVKILGRLPSADDVSFVWLRAFPDEGSRPPLNVAVYERVQSGPITWRGKVMPRLKHYGGRG